MAKSSLKSSSKQSSLASKSKRSAKQAFYQNPRFHALFVALLALVMYGQTLRFGFVVDDKMVITDNSFVQQGFAGIPDLLTKDSFAGFDEQYDRVSQRKTYRPISFISFAIEKQFFNNNPAIAHGINVLLYALTLVVLLRLLQMLFLESTVQPESRLNADVLDHSHPKQHSLFNVQNLAYLPLAATVLFALHPIHTAVVANIKSRDEIFALLFMLSSALFLFRHIRLESPSFLTLSFAWSLVLFLLALLSKESAVLMLPVLILMVLVFGNLGKKRLLTVFVPFVVIAFAYLTFWFGLVGRVEEGLYSYKLHNPFVGSSLAERTATGFMTLGYYFLKAIFPWTLSEAYTYNALPVVSWTDWRALGGFLLVAVCVGYGASRLVRRDVVAFAVLSFFILLVIASNLFVYAGGMLGERFLYTPSVFAVLAIVWLVYEAFGASGKNFRAAPVLGVIAVIATLYAVRGFMRLPDWQTDYKLLQTDHRTHPESIMIARNYASQLVARAGRAQNETEQGILLDEAESVIARALQTDSIADPALYDLQGLCALQRRDYDRALEAANRAIALDSTTRLPIHRKAIFLRNLSSVYVSRGAQRVNENRLNEGVADLQAALKINPMNENAYINLGMVFGRQKELQKALLAFQTAYKVNPSSEIAQQYIFAIQQAMDEEKREKDAGKDKNALPSFER